MRDRSKQRQQQQQQKDGGNHSLTTTNGSSSARRRLPVLIFPGFMSSALEVQESPVYNTAPGGSKDNDNDDDDANNKTRVWLNIASAGFGKLHFGGALMANAERYEVGEDYDEALHQEYIEEYRCKSTWLQHLRLSENDLVSDPPDIQVRATKGIQAVDYLVEHGIAKNASWVFKYVIAALKDVGYKEGHDLDAASYDWRVPPCVLETRDKHFTNTIAQIELMYRQNDDTPVVLLCHSMGCKNCHYFLNFAKLQKGQEWIDRHVHTFFVVGAPHLGAPKSLRGTMLGDRMGLEAFINDEEALILARSWGSIPWLWPRVLSEGTGPLAYLRREGVLHVTVLPFDCGPQLLGSHRKKLPSRLKLAVTYGDQALHSRFHVTADDDDRAEDEFPINFSETFTFATAADQESAKDSTLRISLYEPGMEVTKTCCRMGNSVKSIVDTLFPVEYWRRIGFLRRRPVISGAVEGVAVAAGRIVTTSLGSASLLADSEIKHLSDVELPHGIFESVECSLQLRFGSLKKPLNDYRQGMPKRDIVVGETSSIAIKVRLKWMPPQHTVDTSQLTDISVGALSADPQTLDVRHRRGNTNVQYDPVDGVQLFRSEWIIRHRELMQNYYENDPLGPRGLSAEDAPPVKQVKAVYGINLPTEIAAVYRRRTVVQEKNKRRSLHELDPDARLGPRHSKFVLKDGSVLETDQTPQIVHGQEGMVNRSGDGTVPYFSLQQCRKWQSESCRVQVHELPFAEHREILGDERFLRILIDYVTNRQGS